MQNQVFGQRFYSVSLPMTPFHQRAYAAVEQYPDGEADIVGYWAECMVFGGVVVFDRGKSDNECNAVYFHDGRNGGPFTLYPPADNQLRALFTFLKSPLGQDNPLPILASDLNRYRWDPYYAMKDHHIFRDRYEKRNTESYKSTWKWGARHWPELADQQFLLWAALQRAQGRLGQTYEGQQAANRRLIEASLDRHIGVSSREIGQQ